MQIIPISSPEFLPYGRIVAEVRGSCYAALLKDRAIPKEVEYIPMDSALQALSDTEHIQVQTFGCLPIQAGYCAGHWSTMLAQKSTSLLPTWYCFWAIGMI